MLVWLCPAIVCPCVCAFFAAESGCGEVRNRRTVHIKSSECTGASCPCRHAGIGGSVGRASERMGKPVSGLESRGHFSCVTWRL